MLVKAAEKEFSQPLPGVYRKTLAVGEKGLMVKFVLEAGAVIPPHKHLHEQIGYLLSGNIMLTNAGHEYNVQAGDSWSIVGEAEHSVCVVEKSELVEVFVPIREDYIDE